MTITTMEELAESNLRVTLDQLDGSNIRLAAIGSTDDRRLYGVECYEILDEPYVMNGVDYVYVSVVMPNFDKHGCSGWTPTYVSHHAASWGLVLGQHFTKVSIPADQLYRLELVEAPLPEWERELLRATVELPGDKS